jgi:hypothetical protein
MSNNVEVDELAFMYSKSGNGQTITHKNIWEADAIIAFAFKCQVHSWLLNICRCPNAP